MFGQTQSNKGCNPYVSCLVLKSYFQSKWKFELTSSGVDKYHKQGHMQEIFVGGGSTLWSRKHIFLTLEPK